MVPIRRLSLCIINFPIGNYVCSLLRIVSVVTYRFCILLIMPITQQTLNHRPLFIIGCILYQFSINKNNKIPHGLLIKEKKKVFCCFIYKKPFLPVTRVKNPGTSHQESICTQIAPSICTFIYSLQGYLGSFRVDAHFLHYSLSL